MPTFTDNAGREFNVAITGLGVKKLRSELGINVADGFDARAKEKRSLVAMIDEDYTTLFDVLYVLCQGQCEAFGISGEEFADALFGDAIEHATTALLEALCDFFPSQKRKILRAMLRRTQERRVILTEEQIETAVNQIVDSAMSRSSAFSTSLPESAA